MACHLLVVQQAGPAEPQQGWEGAVPRLSPAMPAPVPSAGRERLLRSFPSYRQLARMSRQVVYVYRANVAFNLVSILIQVYLLRAVWTAVYAGRASVGTLHLHTLITTLTLANLQLWVMFPDVGYLIYQRVREGQVALDIVRPVGFLGQVVAQQIGRTIALLPFVIVALPLALLVGGMQPPASPADALLFLLCLVLAYTISLLLGLLIGLVSFWTLELIGVLFMYRFISQFFGGALVPLLFFPPVLVTLAGLLPFQAQVYLPLQIYLGQADGPAVTRTLALQLVWVFVLAALASYVWRRAVRHLVIQGG